MSSKAILPQLMLDAQDMHDQVLHMRVEAALLNNRVARMDSVLVYDKFQALTRRCDELLARHLPELPDMTDT